MNPNNKDNTSALDAAMQANTQPANSNTISGGTFNKSTINQSCPIENQTIININENPEKPSDFVITEGTDITPTQYFVGRESELETLREQVRSESKLVLVSGMGGIGKTHLCRKLYKEYVDNHKKGKETIRGRLEFRGI